MHRLEVLYRLALPIVVLGGLIYYAFAISPEGSIPLWLAFPLALVLGFIAPGGGWRWTILVGLGVPLVQLAGHVIDAMPISAANQLSPNLLVRDLVPPLIGVYVGVFFHRLFYEGNSWTTKGEQLAQEAALEELHELVEEKKAQAKIAAPAAPKDNQFIALEIKTPSASLTYQANGVEAQLNPQMPVSADLPGRNGHNTVEEPVRFEVPSSPPPVPLAQPEPPKIELPLSRAAIRKKRALHRAESVFGLKQATASTPEAVSRETAAAKKN